MQYDVSFIYRYSAKYAERQAAVFRLNNLKAADSFHLWRFSDVFYNSRLPRAIRVAFFWLDRLADFFLLYHFVWIPFFRRQLRKLKPEVLHINNGGYPGASSCLSIAIAARQCGIKKIIMHVNNLTRKRKWYDLGGLLLDHYVKKSVSRFVTGSKAAGGTLVQNRKISADQVLDINNTLLKDHLLNNTIDSAKLQKAPGETWIGYLGLLTERKGVESLIRAASLLKNKMETSNSKVIIVGDGEESESLKRTAINEGLEHLIVFAGYTTAVASYLQQFDVFVLPSLKDEDFPYVLLEAMLAGKATVSTQVAGIPEIIENGHTGFVVNPGNVDELASKIGLLITRSDLRSQMGAAGYARYFDRFSYEKTIAKFSALYSQAV